MSNELTEIVCAHSPDSDDAYMFTKTGAKTIEYPVSAETAQRLAC